MSPVRKSSMYRCKQRKFNALIIITESEREDSIIIQEFMPGWHNGLMTLLRSMLTNAL